MLAIESITLPTMLTIISTAFFFILERVLPGRPLPHSRNWYLRALLVNFVQLGITLSLARLWTDIFGTQSVFDIAAWEMPAVEGIFGWFVGTFVFYWWHRLRHHSGFWLIFHQIHHSPSRIEVLTSFYKHPVEIAFNSTLTAVILFPILGCSILATFWYNFFAATGEYIYHANYKSPKWLRYLIQTPELHSIHHQLDVHKYNFSDIPIWDRLFGTYKDTVSFMPECGFPNQNEERLGEMLVFKDVYGREHS
jgi:sterol desaturase/sphingolipid hydroxylase (fatty acid hydroxylase superfamily)